jgi:2-haloacid dehalogenase
MPVKPQPKALVFDVFGTCVDWRSSIAREGEELGRRLGAISVDWLAFADAWRAQYQPQMETVRSGQRPWTTLDVLHHEALATVLPAFGLGELSDADRDELTRAWHRLDPWPDVVDGLARLKSRYIIAPNSNGNIALLVNMAKRAGLPWDAILGAEIARAYKPRPEVYLRCAEALGLEPAAVMMVAAHNSDLVTAAECGLQTAFVPRPAEHGPNQMSDLAPERAFDLIATDFIDLANQLDMAAELVP